MFIKQVYKATSWHDRVILHLGEGTCSSKHFGSQKVEYEFNNCTIFKIDSLYWFWVVLDSYWWFWMVPVFSITYLFEVLVTKQKEQNLKHDFFKSTITDANMEGLPN